LRFSLRLAVKHKLILAGLAEQRLARFGQVHLWWAIEEVNT